MSTSFHHRLYEQNCWLSPDRTIFWEEERALIVSDLHFGKTGHFRKEGIPMPQGVYKEDLQRLVTQLQYFQPTQLVVVGDMFHSRANKELELFKKWRHDFPHLIIRLIKGNHDILHDDWYKEAGLLVEEETLSMGKFIFRHDVAGYDQPADSYLFSGHLHPGIRFRGGGRQALHFPCFYFTPSYCILPAFSRFTGLAMIEPNEGDNVFAIVNKSIVPA
jgi:DNA ligase-associated metallophosphoesterase